METMRFKFRRQEDLRFLSHLDQQRVFQRAMRRAGIPIAYSEGYNPHPRLSFALAMPLGLISEAEYGDIRLYEALQPDVFIQRVNEQLPAGLQIIQAWTIAPGTKSLSESLDKVFYTVRLVANRDASDDTITRGIEKMMGQAHVEVLKRNKKGKMAAMDIRPFIDDFKYMGESEGDQVFEIGMHYINQQCIKPALVLSALKDQESCGLCVDERMLVVKTEQTLRPEDDDF
jgi:radical SAM-linked protein